MADTPAAGRLVPATASLRGRIPQLAPAEAATLRELHRCPRQWVGADGTLTLRGGHVVEPGGLFELDADGVRLGLHLTAAPAGADDDALQWQDRQGRARILAWSLAHEAALVRLSDVLGTSLVPATDAVATPTGTDAVWLGFELTPDADAPEPALTGTLRVPLAWLDTFLARDPASALPADPGHWRQLPTPASIAVAGPPLTRADLRSLRPGDVIVVGTTRAPPVHAEAAGQRWPVRASGDGWRIDGPPHSRPRFQETVPMSETDTPDAAGTDAPPPAGDPTAHLPVEVAFELGAVELRLGDIAGLQPGYVFALPAHLEGANVTIRANGRVAGRGELVAVGDTLGVRLIGWS